MRRKVGEVVQKNMWILACALVLAALAASAAHAVDHENPAVGFSIPPGNEAAGQSHSSSRSDGGVRALPPLTEMITSPFGLRRVPGWLSRRGKVMREHTGLDIRARTGWPVVAFKGGRIVRAGPHGLAGIVVEIRQDDGMTARYAHLEKALVTRGQNVAVGAVVGLVGCTGRTTGAHLHFGLRDAQGHLVDPLPYLRSAGQVLRPAPEQIPEELTPQSCGPVIRGRDGRPARLGRVLKELDEYTPPPIPGWKERP